jgi:hypothetical protein
VSSPLQAATYHAFMTIASLGGIFALTSGGRLSVLTRRE